MSLYFISKLSRLAALATHEEIFFFRLKRNDKSPSQYFSRSSLLGCHLRNGKMKHGNNLRYKWMPFLRNRRVAFLNSFSFQYSSSISYGEKLLRYWNLFKIYKLYAESLSRIWEEYSFELWRRFKLRVAFLNLWLQWSVWEYFSLQFLKILWNNKIIIVIWFVSHHGQAKNYIS